MEKISFDPRDCEQPTHSSGSSLSANIVSNGLAVPAATLGPHSKKPTRVVQTLARKRSSVAVARRTASRATSSGGPPSEAMMRSGEASVRCETSLK